MKEETIRAIISSNFKNNIGGLGVDRPKNNQVKPAKFVFQVKGNVLQQIERLK